MLTLRKATGWRPAICRICNGLWRRRIWRLSVALAWLASAGLKYGQLALGWLGGGVAIRRLLLAGERRPMTSLWLIYSLRPLWLSCVGVSVSAGPNGVFYSMAL